MKIPIFYDSVKDKYYMTQPSSIYTEKIYCEGMDFSNLYVYGKKISFSVHSDVGLVRSEAIHGDLKNLKKVNFQK
jgi:hypothetical protein